MTVSYNNVGKVRPFGFGRTLFRWRGSIWKMIYIELILFLFVYFLIALFYSTLSGSAKTGFEKLVLDWKALSSNGPVTFVLGFYVSTMFNRWWEAYKNIPWCDSVCFALNAAIDGDSEENIKIRRAVIRWMLLGNTLAYQSVSQSIQKRFPTVWSLRTLGLVTDEERIEIQNSPYDTHSYFVPFRWSFALLAKCRQDGKITDPILYKHLLEQLEKARDKTGTLLALKWIPIPLIYTHVVTLAVYAYFLVQLISAQFIDKKSEYAATANNHTNWFFPIFTTMEYIILVGWLKAAELMKSPFGHDNDCFELDYIMRRNINVGMDLVSHHHTLPTITKDKFWNQRKPLDHVRKRGESGPEFGENKRRKSYQDNIIDDFKSLLPQGDHLYTRDPMRRVMDDDGPSWEGALPLDEKIRDI
eukprot:g4646.t1